MVKILISDVQRALFALPVHLGGLGISNPQELCDLSLLLLLRLVECIIHQKDTFKFDDDVIDCQRQAKATIVSLKWELQSAKASKLKSILPVELQQILSYH